MAMSCPSAEKTDLICSASFAFIAAKSLIDDRDERHLVVRVLAEGKDRDQQYDRTSD
jgi:hypothetical protein